MKTMISGGIGLMFGFVMSRIGFTSWDLVHRMFTFTDLHLLLTFMLAVGILAVAWIVIEKASKTRRPFSRRRMHPGILVGGALFGAGWALSGACPTAALAQIGEGQLAAIYTVGGIVIGNWLYAVAHERYFKWPATSCLDE
jgi:uncharacterized membrane protein YedE/YeeE